MTAPVVIFGKLYYINSIRWGELFLFGRFSFQYRYFYVAKNTYLYLFTFRAILFTFFLNYFGGSNVYGEIDSLHISDIFHTFIPVGHLFCRYTEQISLPL